MRLLGSFVLVFALSPMLACGIDNTSTPAGRVAEGTYDLQSVDGQSLPFVQPGSSPQTSITGGTLDVAQDGSFTETRQVRTLSTGATQALVSTGKLEIGGSVLSYTLANGTSGLGSVVTNQLQLQFAAGTFLYLKR